MSDGMFLSACRQVSKEFPGIAYDEDLLDRVCLQVIGSYMLFFVCFLTVVRLRKTRDLILIV